MEKKIIKLRDYNSPNSRVFSGRDVGEEVRKKAKLNDLDVSKAIVEIIIPKDTYSVNPSYFLGLFSPSIKKLGIQRFREKYIFICDTSLEEDIEEGIEHAMRELNR